MRETSGFHARAAASQRLQRRARHEPGQQHRTLHGYVEQPGEVDEVDEVDGRLEHLRAGVRIVNNTTAAPGEQSPSAEAVDGAERSASDNGIGSEGAAGGNEADANTDADSGANAESVAAESANPTDNADGGPGSSYPLPALFMRQCLPESAWEPDDSAMQCRQCARRFTLFQRRHHCRRCGLLFCVNCSSKRALLASPVGPAQSGYYAPQADDDEDTPLAMLRGRGREEGACWRFQEHRVCDPCAQAVDQLVPAAADCAVLVAGDGLSTDVSANAHNIFRDPGGPASSGGHQRSRSSGTSLPWRTARARASSSSIRACPVCDRDWATIWSLMRRVPGEGWQEAQERHVRSCIEDTSAEMQGGRYDGESRGADAAAAVASSQPRRSTGFLGVLFERSTPATAAISVSGAGAGAASPGHHVGSAPVSAAAARSARSPAGVKYVAYQLTGDTPLLGEECAICFEDFEPGQRVARLNCLCTYHLWCISEWLQRTPACPVHYE